MSLLDADKHFGGRNIVRFEYFLLLENQYLYTVYLCINIYSIRFLCLKNQESMNEKLPTVHRSPEYTYTTILRKWGLKCSKNICTL